MDKYNIRVCEIEDLQTVYKMICLLEGENPGIEEFTGVFKDNLNDPNIHYIITETDNRPIGFAGMHIQKILHHTGSVGELIEMYVDPDFRNEGIGEAMFWYLRDKAESCGCKHFEVACNIVRGKTKEFFENRGLHMTHYKFTERL